MMVSKKKLKIGNRYVLLSFDGHTHRIRVGHLSKLKNGQLLLQGENRQELYILFSRTELDTVKTGQPIRGGISYGRLVFTAFFVNQKEAEDSVEKMARNLVMKLVEKSINNDKNLISELTESIMNRISLINSSITAKSLPEMAASIKKFTEDKKNIHRKNFSL